MTLSLALLEGYSIASVEAAGRPLIKRKCKQLSYTT